MLVKSIIAGSAFVLLANAQATPASLSLSPAEVGLPLPEPAHLKYPD